MIILKLTTADQENRIGNLYSSNYYETPEVTREQDPIVRFNFILYTYDVLLHLELYPSHILPISQLFTFENLAESLLL